jgi:DNA-binding response OmpR family regulator
MIEAEGGGAGGDRVINGQARVVIARSQGQLAVTMGENGDWVVRLRRRRGEPWRIACTGGLASLAVRTDPSSASAEPISVGQLKIEPAARRALVSDRPVALAKKEFDVLVVLAGNPTRVFTKAELFRTVWGYEMGGARTRTLDSNASRLRRKLAVAGADGLVRNCWGIGYSLLPRDGGARSR